MPFFKKASRIMSQLFKTTKHRVPEIYCFDYRQSSNISLTISHNVSVSRLVLPLSLPNPLKPGVKSRMNMDLVQRLSALLQLLLSDQQFYCLLGCHFIRDLTVHLTLCDIHLHHQRYENHNHYIQTQIIYIAAN